MHSNLASTAMKTTENLQIAIKIATTPNFGPDHANENYLFGEIQFNDDVPIISDNVSLQYRIQPCALTQHELNTKFAQALHTKELAAVITDFISALRECHGPPTESSLLFGEHARSRYTCVGDGLLVAAHASWIEDTLPNYEENETCFSTLD